MKFKPIPNSPALRKCVIDFTLNLFIVICCAFLSSMMLESEQECLGWGFVFMTCWGCTLLVRDALRCLRL